MYLAFFIPKEKKQDNANLVYAKYDIGWKVNNIAIGYYTQQGKTATELFEIAKIDYAHGYLVNAINNIMLAANCLSGSAYLKAANGEDIKSFSKKIIDEANSKINYPVVLNNIKSKPAIFTISSNSKEDRFTQYVLHNHVKISRYCRRLEKKMTRLNNNYPQFFRALIRAKRLCFTRL
jgi:hypothetical protein